MYDMVLFYVEDTTSELLDIEPVQIVALYDNEKKCKVAFFEEDHDPERIVVSPEELFPTWVEANISRIERRLEELKEYRIEYEKGFVEHQQRLKQMKDWMRENVM